MMSILLVASKIIKTACELVSCNLFFSLKCNDCASISEAHNVGPPLASKGCRSVLSSNGHLVTPLVLGIKHLIVSFGTETEFLLPIEFLKALQSTLTIRLGFVIVLISLEKWPLDIFETLVGNCFQFLRLIEATFYFFGFVFAM